MPKPKKPFKKRLPRETAYLKSTSAKIPVIESAKKLAGQGNNFVGIKKNAEGKKVFVYRK